MSLAGSPKRVYSSVTTSVQNEAPLFPWGLIGFPEFDIVELSFELAQSVR